jgi:SAM-dependent methyltransferase
VEARVPSVRAASTMSGKLLEQCGLCASDRLRSVLQVGSSPPTCAMWPVGTRHAGESHHPLELLRCEDCTLVQLSVVVDPVEVFPPDYPYQSGNSRALHDNFEDLARQVGPLPPDALVVDIGANDGTLLSKFDGCRTVGVEPTGQATRIKGPAYRAFFTHHLAQRILLEHGPADVITACNVLAHVPDIGEVMKGINTLLDKDGILVAENHDLASVVAGQWDTVYHEHLRFYDPYSFHQLLDRHALHSHQWQAIPTHGGSFRAVASRGRRGWPPPKREYDFDRLARRMAESRGHIRRAARGVCGIGATARATTIINYCGLDVEDVECVCEVAGSDKIGRYIPGTRIPVVDESRLVDEQQDSMLFSWHLKDVIVPKLRERGYTGRITVPLPTVHSV